MPGRKLVGLGAFVMSLLAGCGDGEQSEGSKVGQAKGGAGGAAGSGGALSLPGLSGAGSGGGGASGAGGMAGGGAAQGGTGGEMSSAGKSGGGAGGSKPVGMCKRVAGSDADCVDFWADDRTQAYACDDTSAASTLNGMHGGNCASTSGIPGGKYGMCCPP